jgi:hypothetical protein
LPNCTAFKLFFSISLTNAEWGEKSEESPLSVCRPFLQLEKSDQRILLARNGPLFVQLFMGCYLLAQGGQTSHKSKVESSFGKKVWMSNFLQNLHLEKLDTTTGLFLPGTDLDQYAKLINRLKGLSALAMEHKAVLAFALLFDHNADVRLTSRSALADLSSCSVALYDSHVKTCDDCLDLPGLSKTLIEMADFCARNVAWGSKGSATIMENTYTAEEEQWLRQQFRRIEDAFRSVQTGEKLIHEFLAAAAGIRRLPETHYPEVFRIFEERVMRMSKIHPEFEALSEEQKQQLLEKNLPLVMALAAVKAENCSNGIEQLQDGFGDLDEIVWKEKYLPFIANPSNIRKIDLADDLCIPRKIVLHHRDLVDRLKILTSDPDTYRLNLLLVLTQPAMPGASPAMEQVHMQYKTLLRRRVGWMCKQNPDTNNTDQILSHIFACQNLLPLLAEIMQDIRRRH